jgi:hypothetical protein
VTHAYTGLKLILRGLSKTAFDWRRAALVCWRATSTSSGSEGLATGGDA